MNGIYGGGNAVSFTKKDTMQNCNLKKCTLPHFVTILFEMVTCDTNIYIFSATSFPSGNFPKYDSWIYLKVCLFKQRHKGEYRIDVQQIPFFACCFCFAKL